MTKEEIRRKRRLKRKIKVISRWCITGLVLIGIIVLIIVLISNCAHKHGGSENGNKGSDVSVETATGEAGSDETTSETTEETTAEQTKSNYTAEDYEAAGVDELNSVPIIMYHRVLEMSNSETEYTGGNIDEDGYARTSEAFEADLERYYEEGYRCMRLTDFVDGNIDVEFGYSPVIITFDDGIDEAMIDGFDSDGNPIFTEDSALSVLERVKERHPDFNVTATFFVNWKIFCNEEEDDIKLLKWLVNNGYDVGNHTWEHPNLTELTADEIEEQVGRIYEMLEEYIPGQYVNIVALPYGLPIDMDEDAKYQKILDGTWNGTTYHTKATLLCSWTYEDSRFSTEYSNTYIKRIHGYDNNGENFDLEYNFDLLADGRRYISDGNPDTIVIREEDEQWLGDDCGKEVITY